MRCSTASRSDFALSAISALYKISGGLSSSDVGRLSTRILEHCRLEGDTHGIITELARQCFGKCLNDPLWIDAFACSHLVHQGVAEHKCAGIGSDIGDRLLRAQHCDPEVAKTGCIQGISDRIDPMLAELHLIELRRILRKSERGCVNRITAFLL